MLVDMSFVLLVCFCNVFWGYSVLYGIVGEIIDLYGGGVVGFLGFGLNCLKFD